MLPKSPNMLTLEEINAMGCPFKMLKLPDSVNPFRGTPKMIEYLDSNTKETIHDYSEGLKVLTMHLCNTSEQIRLPVADTETGLFEAVLQHRPTKGTGFQAISQGDLAGQLKFISPLVQGMCEKFQESQNEVRDLKVSLSTAQDNHTKSEKKFNQEKKDKESAEKRCKELQTEADKYSDANERPQSMKGEHAKLKDRSESLQQQVISTQKEVGRLTNDHKKTNEGNERRINEVERPIESANNKVNEVELDYKEKYKYHEELSIEMRELEKMYQALKLQKEKLNYEVCNQREQPRKQSV